MFPGAYLSILLLLQVGETQVNSPAPTPVAEKFTPYVLKQMTNKTGIDLSWADAEDKLTGSITPLTPMEGEAMTVSVRVGTYEGKDFDGPVRFVLRPEGGAPMEQLVKKTPEDRAWVARFTPPAEGHYQLEVSFSSSHNKVLTGAFEVQSGRMPRWPWYIFAVMLVGAGVAAGMRFAKKED
jgi:hypothetical protein